MDKDTDNHDNAKIAPMSQQEFIQIIWSVCGGHRKQKDFAALIGVSANTVSLWLKDTTRLSKRDVMLFRMLRFYGADCEPLKSDE